MTDRLGEALAAFTIDPIMAPRWARKEVVAAARSWQILTNPTDELIERVAATLYTQKWGPSMSGAKPGAKERETAYAILDALTVTAEEAPDG